MTNNSFDPVRAAKAQEDYCNEHKAPIFAPRNGWCVYCGKNIYEPYKVHSFCGRGDQAERVFGITVEEAGSRLITGCPHCNRTFCG